MYKINFDLSFLDDNKANNSLEIKKVDDKPMSYSPMPDDSNSSNEAFDFKMLWVWILLLLFLINILR